jgi:hypothetical protein
MITDREPLPGKPPAGATTPLAHVRRYRPTPHNPDTAVIPLNITWLPELRERPDAENPR